MHRQRQVDHCSRYDTEHGAVLGISDVHLYNQREVTEEDGEYIACCRIGLKGTDNTLTTKGIEISANDGLLDLGDEEYPSLRETMC